MKKSGYNKIKKKYEDLVKTIAEETNCTVHSSLRKSLLNNYIEIEILTLGERIDG